MAPTKKSIIGFVIAYFLLFFINFSSQAQARIAIVGGVNSSTVLQTSNQPNFDTYKNGYSPRIGFHIGFMADFPLTPKSKFYFQPAIEYFNKGRKFAQTTKNGTGDTAVYQTTASQYINYIDIPLNLIYKFELAKKIALIVGLGPYISFFYGGKTNSTTLGPNNYYQSTGEVSNLPTGDGPGQYSTLDYGINAVAGIDMGGSFITANFSHGLSNAYRDSNYTGTFKNQVFSITLGVYLGERKKKKPQDKIDTTADKDCDGIIDKNDFCPTVFGLKKYHGCPIPDSDCDSINDEQDKCPYILGLRRYDGCPIPDTDGDSVNDEEDKCLTTRGLPQYQGCPIPIDETLPADSIVGDTMIYVIYYDANKIRINVKGAVTLSKLRNLLKANDDLNIKISGYSDKSRSAKIARQQSANRAVIVKKYFKSNGIPAGRMKLYYWGATRAVFPRTNKIDQWKDRKVEIAVYQKPKKVVTAVVPSAYNKKPGATHKHVTTKHKPAITKHNVQGITNHHIPAEATGVVVVPKKKHTNNNTQTHTINQAANSNLASSTTNTAIKNSSAKNKNQNVTSASSNNNNKNSAAAKGNKQLSNNTASNSNNAATNKVNKNTSITNGKPVKSTATVTTTAIGVNSSSIKNKTAIAKNNSQAIATNKTSSSNANNKNNNPAKNKPQTLYVTGNTNTSSSKTNSNTSKANKPAIGTSIIAGSVISTNTAANKKASVKNNNNQLIGTTSTGNTAVTNKSNSSVKITPQANHTTIVTGNGINKNSNSVKNNPLQVNSNSATTGANSIGNSKSNNVSVVGKTNQASIKNSTVNNTAAAIGNSADQKFNIAKNNQQPSNNSATIINSNTSNTGNNKNTAANKINNNLIDQLDTADIDEREIEKTISTTAPAQINDTDRVLDCYTIYFDPNQSILNSASFDILDHIREILRTDSTLYIGISGYSERIGSEKSAQLLSQERAYLARDYMNSYGVTIDRMRVSYWGSKIPVADDNDIYQQWENRRVEICIYFYPK